MSAAPNILVVDDNAAALKSTTLILQNAGYDVIQAEDGAAALREVHARRPSLVLLDVELPDISGLEVLRQIRAEPAWNGVSVVLVSSHRTLPEQQAGGLDTGADGYIARPMASAELLARVRSQLRQRDLAEKLRASEQRYRRLFESAKDGILILDAGTGMVVDVNPFLIDLLGFSHEDFMGKKVWELGLFKDIVASEAHFRELQEKEYIRFEDQPLETVDGRRIDVEFVSNVYLVEGQKVIQCNIRDITERRRLEIATRESEERFRTMANSIPQLAWIARADGHITWYNRRWYEYTGTTLEQMEGWGWQSVHDPAVLPRVMAGWKDAIEAGKPFEMEFPLRGADGQFRFFLTRVEPWKNAEGRVVQWFGTNTDVEALRQARAESERRLRELEVILDSVPALVFYKDRESRFVRVNRELAQLVGVPPQDFLGKTDAEMGSPQAEKYRADDLKVMDSGESIRHREEQLFTPRGVRWLLTDKIPHRDKTGKITGLVCFAVDITERKRAQEALRQSRGRLAGIVNSAMDAIISIDAQQRIVLFNAAAEKMFGHRANEMTGQPLDRLLPARFGAGHARHVDGFAHSGVTTRKMVALGAISGVRASGEEFPIEASISQVEVAGETLCTVILRDITERVRSAASAAHLAAIVESSEDAIIGKDLSGVVSSWNAGAEQLFGYSSQEMVGRSISQLIPTDRHREETEILRQVRAGESIRHFDTVRRCKDGSLLDVSITVSAIKDATGTVVGASKVVRDITERKRAEAALRESETKFRALIEHSHDGIALAGTDGAVLYASPSTASILGYLPEDLARRSILEFVVPAGQTALREKLREALRCPGVGIPVENYVRHKNGQRCYLEGVLTNLLHEPGVGAIVINYHDVTERKEAEDALRQSGEELRALASHLDQIREEQAARIAQELHDELGQMLTILKLHLRSLQRQLTAHTGEASTLESREAEELIEGAVRSVRQLCTELRPPTLDHLGLRPALEALAADFRTRSGIEYTFSAPADFPLLDAARQTTVYRIVQELLTNVARHARASEVRIELRVDEAGLDLEVTDNGRGIAAEDLAGKGSLGLLGMRERALAAGGRMTIAAHPGGGTTGHAHLPLTAPPAAS